MRFMSTLCAVALMTPAAGLAQMAAPDNPQVDVGSRVRVAAPVFGTKAKQVGTVVSVAPDTVVLRLGATIPSRSLAISDLTSLEVARGKHTRKATGALWGTLIGAGVAGVLGYALYEEPKCSTDAFFGCIAFTIGPTSRGSNTMVSAVAGGLVGALVGTLVGGRATDTWVPATLSSR
jgi:hypothetical protein